MSLARDTRQQWGVGLCLPGIRLSPCEIPGYLTLASNQYYRDITKDTQEILFEVWDQGHKVGQSDMFLGLTIGKIWTTYHYYYSPV